MRPETLVLRHRRWRPRTVTPRPWMIPAVFAATIALGALLLALPIASETRQWTSGWDALFTSASAVCVTGLVRVDTAEHWSGFGEAVILGLFQLGGLGVTMMAGMLLLVAGRRFGLRGREFFGMELADVGGMDIRRLLRRVLVFVAVVEVVTFLLLLPWALDQTAGGRGVWMGLFHAVSAFNNAGFDLMGGMRGLTGQVDSAYPLVVMGVAAFLGSMSFITVFDLRRRPRRWSLDTKFVVVGMLGLTALGMLIIVVAELQSGRVLHDAAAGDVVANAFFLSVNRTTGMSTVDMSALREATTVVLLVLMFIGGASTSTSGGIKVGSFMVSAAVVVSALRGRHRPQAFGREIPEAVVLRAIVVAALGVVTVVLGIWALEVTDDVPFLPLVFEVMSAAANVGWSHNLTPTLSTAGAMVLVVLIYVGRIGPLMVALSVPSNPDRRYRFVEAGVRIG